MPYADPADRRAASRRRYADDPDRATRRQLAFRARRREKVGAIKEASPCADCGRYYPACVMDFDHVRGTKAFNVARMVGLGVGWTRIEAEIAKCDIVCSNCHRLRTFTRG